MELSLTGLYIAVASVSCNIQIEFANLILSFIPTLVKISYLTQTFAMVQRDITYVYI